MFVITLIAYCLIGAAAGFLAGLLGIGGGLVVVPALVLMFNILGFAPDYLMQVAVGTSLGAMILTAASSAWAHIKQQGVNWHFVKILGPGVVLGSIFGALIADYLPSNQLESVFGISLCLIGIYFLCSSDQIMHELDLPSSVVGIIGIGIGGLSSILGIGGGIMTVPVLHIMKRPLREAISTSAAIGFLIAITGAISFLYFGSRHPTFEGTVGYVYIPAFIVIGLTAFFFAPFGAKMAYTLPVKTLKIVFGMVLILVGIAMVVDSIG